MTIECSTSAPTPPSAAPAKGSAGRDNTDNAAPGLFSSLLTGLDAAPADSATPIAKDALDSPLGPDAGPAVLPDPAAQVDAAAQALLAQFLGLGKGAAPMRAGATQSSPDAATLALQAQLTQALGGVAAAAAQVGAATLARHESLQGQTATALAGCNVSGASSGPTSPVLTQPGHNPAPPALSGAPALVGVVDAGALAAPASSTSSAVRAALANAQGMVQWQQTQATQSATLDLAASRIGGRDAMQELAMQPQTPLVNSPVLPGLVGALAGSDGVALGRPRERSAAASQSARQDVLNLAGAGAPTLDATPGGVPASATAPMATPLALAVGEQVKYWVTNDVRNAELKLDGLGTQSVQVSISMSGHEAQVVFRSDQPQTRELLGNAMGQLEQMMRGEGITLSGAWVGASGQQGNSSANSQQPPAGPAPAALGAVQAAGSAVAAPVRRSQPTDRVLDIFA